MKLYILDAYYLKIPDKGNLTPGIDEGQPVTIPVPLCVIEHPQGNVLFDTGLYPEHWPDFMQSDAVLPETDLLSLLKEKTGIAGEDIRYVVMSHLHVDHTGGMSLFPNATFVVRREEMKEAWWPSDRSNAGGGYVFDDFAPTRHFNFIELQDNETYDLFGDGSVICADTKGHSRGHQSIVLKLPKAGTVVLAADASHFEDNLTYNISPGTNIWNKDEALKSLAWLRQYRDKGAMIIFGHDPVQWNKLKKAPQYYD